MDLEKVLLVAFMLVLGGGMTWLLVHVIRTSRRVEQAWQRFAAETPELRVEPGPHGWPQITGALRGRKVNARIVNRGGSGDNQSHHTLVSTPCRRALPNDFALRPQGWFFALEKAYGAQDVAIGDASFDRAFVVECADERAGVALLGDSDLRRVLLEQAENEPALCVMGGQALVENNGMVTKAAELRSMFEAVVRVAEAVDHATGAPAAVAHAHAAGTTQHWIIPHGQLRQFAAVMTFPLGFALAALSAGLLLPKGYGWVGLASAALVVAVALKILLPAKARLRLDAEQLSLDRAQGRKVWPLRQSHFWCGPWQKAGYVCGSVLYIQVGDQQLSIGGAQHSFDDPRWYQAEPGADPDIVMLKRPFADLLNGLGYATRRLHK